MCPGGDCIHQDLARFAWAFLAAPLVRVILSEKDARKSAPIQNPTALFSEQAARDCPETIGFGQGQTR
jgi:hypothetical protein